MSKQVVVNVLNEDGTPKTPEQLQNESAAIVANGDTPIMPGSDTHPTVLLTSLKEEREKVQRLENELKILKDSPASPEVTTEEGKALQKKIDEGNARIDALTTDNLRKDLYMQYPALKDKSADFEKYLADPDNEGMSLQTAAKAFMVENNIPVRRLGLEKPTGGDRQPPSTGMTVEDIRILRETNFKKYQELLKKGIIKFQ